MTDFEPLLRIIDQLPAADLPDGRVSILTGTVQDGNWWVEFQLDTTHELAWRHVQEFAHILNMLSLQTLLPTVFKPLSPAPHLNGGVKHLSWVIASKDPEFTPAECARWLANHLPNPLSDPAQWVVTDY